MLVKLDSAKENVKIERLHQQTEREGERQSIELSSDEDKTKRQIRKLIFSSKYLELSKNMHIKLTLKIPKERQK